MKLGHYESSTGRRVIVTDPDASVIVAEDIGLSLARQCRFAGHIKPEIDHYSVAQHSLIVARLCKPEHRLIGLLHDATEAYLQDLISPIKHTLGADYIELERAWAKRIGLVFDLGGALADLPRDVIEADARALETERRDLRVNYTPGNDLDPAPERIYPLDARASYRAFMHQLRALHG